MVEWWSISANETFSLAASLWKIEKSSAVIPSFVIRYFDWDKLLKLRLLWRWFTWIKTMNDYNCKQEQKKGSGETPRDNLPQLSVDFVWLALTAGHKPKLEGAVLSSSEEFPERIIGNEN